MDVRIKSLKLKNFKGIPELEIAMNGSNISISGKNATGKTTLFDAFTWCLFGKDSGDRSDFWVKPHDRNGNEIHNLETEVEADLTIDGKQRKFRHLVAENWVKKNGQSDRVYSGNTHSYWVNDVSKSANEYAKAVSEIVDADRFKLITNPMAFNALKWDKRREFLLSISPVDVDKALLSKDEYEPIAEALAHYGTDISGIRKVKAESKKRDNEELNMIPVRISEQKTVLDSLGDCDIQKAEAEVKLIDQQIEQLESAMNSGSAIIDMIKAKSKAVTEAEQELHEAKRLLMNTRRITVSKTMTEFNTAKILEASKQAEKESLTNKIIELTEWIKKSESELTDIRNQWYQTDEIACPEYEGSDICPTCGQKLPEGMYNEAKQRFIDGFEKDKEKRLEAINKNGMELAEKVAKAKENLETMQSDMIRIDKEEQELTAKLKVLEVEVSALDQEPDFSKDANIARLEANLAKAKADYDDASSQRKPIDEGLLQQKRDLVERKNVLLSVKARAVQQETCEQRISALAQRQQQLGIQVAETEQFLMLLDQFITERCGMLEESINKLFPSVRWSLFDQQINGGIKDTCVCLINGVQFSDANNAARINAGLEIIDVLSQHYGVSVPVFIDNAEAVNTLYQVASQCIMLRVTEDETLKIEEV